MTPLDTLAPDQRAVLELVLRQGRSYGELSELLGIPERDVRARADAGLRALAGEPVDGVDSGRIADWLLGQQPDAEAERTRAAVARSEPSRAWAAMAAERLIVLGGSVPDIPEAAEAAEPAARPRPLREGSAPRPRPVRAEAAPAAAGPRSSRLGGAVVLGVVAVVVAGFLVWMFALRDDDESPAASAPTATATATATPDPAAANDIALTGANGSQAVGFLRLLRSKDGIVRFGLAAEKVPPNGQNDSYAVWFTSTGAKPRRLGFAQNPVGQDGVLTTAGPQKSDEDDFPKWFATYEKVLVTKETTATAKKPGPAILEGTLPAGAG
jgi:Sigma-70, region 4